LTEASSPQKQTSEVQPIKLAITSADISNKENQEILLKHEAPEEVQFSLKPDLRPLFKAN